VPELKLLLQKAERQIESLRVQVSSLEREIALCKGPFCFVFVSFLFDIAHAQTLWRLVGEADSSRYNTKAFDDYSVAGEGGEARS